jgi:signal transduction histidine kinase
MSAFRQFLLIALSSARVSFGAIDAPETPDAKNETIPPASTNGISSVTGTITWIDADRNLIVLQEGSHAEALRVDLPGIDLKPGEHVVLEGRRSPLIAAFPDYPDKPSASEIRPSFEGPTDWADYYLTRMRGFVRPPATGKYTFWIASDDSSELWLSDGVEPAKARRIASVGNGRWTDPHQWNRFPSQQSQEILLQAGQSYYIEAISQEGVGKDCLAVAWQGPGIAQSVIDGNYLHPWRRGGEGSTNGILREYWNNFYSSDFSALTSPDPFIVNFHETRVADRQRGELPEPVRILPGEKVEPEYNFRRIEIDGRLSFSSKAGGQANLELADGSTRVGVHVADDATRLAAYPENSLVRVRGVCEAARGPGNEWLPANIWVGSAAEIVWLDTDENWSQFKPLPVHLLAPSNPDLAAGRLIRVRGRVIHEESPGTWSIQGDDTFQGYTSSDGTNWISIGPPVEFMMTNSVLAGFAVASHQKRDVATAQFDHVSGLAAPFQTADIGNPGRRGSFDFNGSTLTLRGCGEDIWFISDQCYFAYQKLDGEGEIIARLARLDSADPLAKTGVMIRETLDSRSRWAAMVFTPTGRSGLQSRRENGRNTAGALLSRSMDWIKLTRRRSELLFRADRESNLSPGMSVDVLGTLSWSNTIPLLADARYRKVADGVASPVATGGPNPTGELHDVLIKDLGTEAGEAEMAGRQPRNRIRGVVTFNDQVSGERLLFVQDASGGCVVRLRLNLPRESFKVGNLVELTGALVPTNGVQEFSANGIASVGVGTMPQPLRYPFEPGTGRQDGQWVEVQGVGRSIAPNGTLLVMTRDGILPVRIGRTSGDRPNDWVNASLRIRGVYWPMPEPTLLTPSARFVEINEPSPQNAFDIPSFPMSALQGLNANPESTRRLKVAGVVTCVRDNFFLVQDESGGACVETTVSPGLKPGDAVEVVGFPSERATGPVFSEALARITGSGKLPEPARVSMGDVLGGRNNCRLITLDAVVLEQRATRGIQSIDLQAGQRAFRAVLPDSAGRLPRIANGSRIQVTGVSQIERLEHSSDESGRTDEPLVASLELLLRNPGDITVLQRPPWWNWKYTIAAIGFFAAVLAGSLIWIRTLRRRVGQRTRELQETMSKLQKETRISATLAERDRLAGEIHDSLEQGLSAIMMQMDAAAKLIHQPEEVSRYLATARNMAGFSRAEVQHAVWDLQSPMLENADLGTALRRVAREISAGDTPQVSVEISGQARPLPSTVEHHLLRIGQEAVTNAVKHGQPKTIRLTLEYGINIVSLSVHDDGCGFDPTSVAPGNGHFGLQGLKARARKLNASLTLSSRPGDGTRIEIAVPLDTNMPSADSPSRNSLKPQ